MSLKPRTKETLRYLGASLLSNDACIAGGRERGWYFAVPIALVSVVLAAVPIISTYFTQDGGAIINGSNTMGLDTALIGFQEAMAGDESVSFKVGEDHVLEGVNLGNIFATELGAPHYDLERTYEDGSKEIVFRVYYYGDVDSSSLASLRDGVLSGTSPNAAAGEEAVYDVTTLFMADSLFYLNVSPNYNGTNDGASITGDYTHFEVGTDLADMATISLDGSERTVTYAGASSITSANYETYYEESMDNWAKFFSLAYSNTAVTTGWIQSGTALGVFAAMCIVMGLMVFLMTRGKNNPFRIYTFWECQKIAYWAAFTPALLSLFGFLMPSMAIMIFVALYGMRVVWLSMKNLRPVTA